jgi:hypothetical protein
VWERSAQGRGCGGGRGDLLEGEFVFGEKPDASIDHIRVIKAALFVLNFLESLVQT